MQYVRRFLALLFLVLLTTALWHCARRGAPSGGEKDVTPPKVTKTEPENYTINFEAKRIRLYFDEFIKLEDVQNQLVVSPPLQYKPIISPQSGASKYVEVVIKDTLLENTTYTINFGQSIVDNNEGNPNSFLTYVFSTGDYIDSLSVAGAVKDAFNRKADEFVSVMLYALDSAYTDSVIYQRPPNYITNTLDSLPIFELKNLKAGQYKLFAIKDVNKNNLFDQRQDKIGFLSDTITIPTNSVYLLNLFTEIPNYSASVPSYVAKNRVLFGFQGDFEDVAIETLLPLPDSVQTRILKDREKDTLNYWLTPTDVDSILFLVKNEKLDQLDTFTVKTRKLPLDSLLVSSNLRGKLGFEDSFSLLANTPIVGFDTSKISFTINDSLPGKYEFQKDTLGNKIDFSFPVEPNQQYGFEMLPGTITDFFGMESDSLSFSLSTGSYADYGNLRLFLSGEVVYPVVVQLTNEKGEIQREIISKEPGVLEFNNLDPSQYVIRVIFDTNGNGIWDTGNYLKGLQPERISYYPDKIEVRANWELEQNFIISQ
ncbi:MAG: Ig-like domain-containing protein [Bacteroidota bacterium]